MWPSQMDEQRQMLEARVMIVDENDKVVGSCTKYEAHRTELGPQRHRAFSLFLFDASGRLLLQRRSALKLTWPLIWANTCCSHPGVDEGIIPAVVRRVKFELNLDIDPVLCELCECGVFEYTAVSGVWTEHEIDHVVFGFFDRKDIPFNVNEVSEIRWVSSDELGDWIAARPEELSPWLIKIREKWLAQRWSEFVATHRFPDASGAEIVRL